MPALLQERRHHPKYARDPTNYPPSAAESKDATVQHQAGAVHTQ